MRPPIFAIFRVNGRLLGQTRSRKQHYIRRLARAYAHAHLGETVEIEYPTLCIIREG